MTRSSPAWFKKKKVGSNGMMDRMCNAIDSDGLLINTRSLHLHYWRIASWVWNSSLFWPVPLPIATTDLAHTGNHDETRNLLASGGRPATNPVFDDCVYSNLLIIFVVYIGSSDYYMANWHVADTASHLIKMSHFRIAHFSADSWGMGWRSQICSFLYKASFGPCNHW